MKLERQVLEDIVQNVLQQCKNLGMDEAEVAISQGEGLSLTVRLNEVETIEFNKDKTLSLTVYKEKRKGSVNTSDFDPKALNTIVEAACRIANYTEADPYSGLADASLMAKKFPDLELYYPRDILPNEAMEWAKECEESARTFDPRIFNSEGATFNSSQAITVYGNSHGFIGGYPESSYSLSCSVIAKEKDSLQRNRDFTIARNLDQLSSKTKVGKNAALKAIKQLNPRKIKTCEAPVIFAAEIAPSIVSHFIAAITGSNLYRKSSFLVDALGKKVFPESVHIKEAPHIKGGLGSAPFDQEGVATEERTLIKEGILQSYVLNSYAARKLGQTTTGNAGGIHNLLVSYQNFDLDQLLKEMGTGLLVTELMGHGVNLVTGDYSKGASGFWVENGEIQYPVQEITIAGNLKEMFLNLIAIGNDTEKRSAILTGSLWFNRMTIAGN